MIAYIALVRIEDPKIYAITIILFLFAPALSCVAGGLTDYRIVIMILVYTLVGAFFFGMSAPAAAIGPSQRELYHATRHLAGDIGAWREIIGGCALAIGRILFIRNRSRKTEEARPESNH